MIFPKPQKLCLQRKISTPSGFKITGDETAFSQKILSGNGINTFDGTYTVEIKIEDTEETSYIAQLSALTDEKYYIYLGEKDCRIVTSCKKGLYRALQTFSRIVLKGEFFTGTIEDYPLFTNRGYIEGFYGKQWEQEKRLSVMKLMAQNGMNTYFYAPKDDVYHREKWAEEYPPAELENLRTLFSFATENFMSFTWCVGPGLTYCYTDKNDFERLIGKFRQLYGIGIKSFGLLLDDIADDFQYEADKEKYSNIVYAHTELVNKVYKALKELDADIHLTVCPTQYFGDEHGFYIQKFGTSVPSEVSVFWTGAEICSRVLTSREAKEFILGTNHKPLFWDNFPVNDCEMFQEMHLNYIEGRDKDLYKYSDGLISNVMEYAECSKIPLLTVCDYLWNPAVYNGAESLKNAQYTVLGDKTEKFFYFADHLGVSCLNKYSSGYMSDTLRNIYFYYNSGEKEKAFGIFNDYLKAVNSCNEMLKEDFPIFNELKKWSGKFAKSCKLLELLKLTMENPNEENKDILKTELEKYNSDAVILTGFCLREAAEKALLL